MDSVKTKIRTAIFSICLLTMLPAWLKAQDRTIEWFEPTFGLAGTKVVISIHNINPTEVYFNGVRGAILKKTSDHLVVSLPAGANSGPISMLDNGREVRSAEIFSVGSKDGPAAAPAQPFLTKKPAPAVTEKTTPVAQDQTASKKIPVPAAGTGVSEAPSKTAASQPKTTIESPSRPAQADAGATKSQPVVKTAEAAAPESSIASPKPTGKPLILGFDPKEGPAGTRVRISGLNFGFNKADVRVSIHNEELSVESVYDQQIEVSIPGGSKESGSFTVIVNGKKATSKGSYKTQ